MQNTKKWKKLLLLCFCVLLIAFGSAALVLAYTASKPIQPTLTATAFEQNYINRVRFSLDATEFVFMRESSGKYMLEFTFTAEKTQADFYAVLDDFQIVGLPYSSMTVTAAEQNGKAIPIPGAELPGSYDGTTTPLQWTVKLEFETDTPVTHLPQLLISYTSGTKFNLAESYQTEVDLLVKVCDLAPLPQIMEDAESYFTLGLYTEASLARLREKLDDIEYALRSPQDISDSQVSQWLQEIADCISTLMPI